LLSKVKKENTIALNPIKCMLKQVIKLISIIFISLIVNGLFNIFLLKTFNATGAKTVRKIKNKG
jgi:hypothetical protein